MESGDGGEMMRDDGHGSISDLRLLLSSLERDLRGTPVSRLHSALSRARARATQDQGVYPFGEPQRATPGFRTEPELLPSHLPPLPEWFRHPEACGSHSRLRARRVELRKLCWRWSE